jgi:hypothetical protein
VDNDEFVGTPLPPKNLRRRIRPMAR